MGPEFEGSGAKGSDFKVTHMDGQLVLVVLSYLGLSTVA